MVLGIKQYNIFRINEYQKSEFIESIQNANEIVQMPQEKSNDKITLYYFDSASSKKIKWEWLLIEFDIIGTELYKVPSAILLVELDVYMYAITFGISYHKVIKYCDRKFAFDFAKKLNYEEVKSTAHTSPNTKKIKVINSYLNNNIFEYESGEAFLKIKGKAILSDSVPINSNIEVGSSLKVNGKVEGLTNLIKIIKYIEFTIEKKENITKIPMFSQINEKVKLNFVNNIFIDCIKESKVKFSMSDFNIIGTNEFFYNNTAYYKVVYKSFVYECNELSHDILTKFCEEYELNLHEIIFDIKVACYNETGKSKKLNLIDIIDYTIDEHDVTLINGVWYEYNFDYLECISNSLENLDATYDPLFDWDDEYYKKYIDEKIKLETQIDENKNNDRKCLKEKIGKKFYNELVYNKSFERYGFRCIDRNIEQIDKGNKIEIADLHKNDTLYSVKIGGTSAKLCYVINQLKTSMDLIKSKKIPEYVNIKVFCIVILLEVADGKKVHFTNNKVDFSQINLLSFKNALDEWQKNVRKNNFIPKLIIGYKRTKK